MTVRQKRGQFSQTRRLDQTKIRKLHATITCGIKEIGEKMKLVHLAKYHWPDNGGGISKSIDMAVHSFEQYRKNKPGYTQEVICCWEQNGKPGSKDFLYNGIPVYRCKSLFTKLSTQFSTEFLQTVKNRVHEDDFVIYNFPYPLVDLAVLLGLIRGTLIVWWHCDFEIKGKLANELFRPLVNYTLKKAKKIIISSLTGKRILLPKNIQM